MALRPYGEDTIVIPFEVELPPSGPTYSGMSRMRPRGELFRNGVARPTGSDGGEGGVVQAQYAPAAPIPLFPPSVFIPGSPANEEFVRSTERGLRTLRERVGTIFETRRNDRPPPGSKPIDETPWSGDHGKIKDDLDLGGKGSVKIAPNGDVGSENPDGSWTNEGPAEIFTGSGNSAGRRGKDRRGNEPRRGGTRGDPTS